MRRTLYGASKDERIAARYIPKNAAKVELKSGAAVVYLYGSATGKLGAIGYIGTAGKPAFHFVYRDEQRRRESVQQFFAGVQSTQEYKAKYRAERKAERHTFTVGQILNTSWGYDQTNVDFYVVTRVSSACVWVRPIASDYQETGFMSGRCWPAMPLQMTGKETRHVAQGKYISINGHSASVTDGDCYCSSYA